MWINVVSVACFTRVEEGEMVMLEWINVFLLLLYLAQLTFVSSCAAPLLVHREKIQLLGLFIRFRLFICIVST